MLIPEHLTVIFGQYNVYRQFQLLKLGTQRNKLELEKLRKETELLSAKTTAIQSAEKVEQLYQDAMAAMKSYSGQDEADDPDLQRGYTD